MTVNLTPEGYKVLRERAPVIEWYVELQTSAGVAVADRFALVSNRVSATNINPMTFALPISGGDVASLPCQIEKVELYEASIGGDPLSEPESIEALLLVLEADQGTVNLTINLPAEA